MAILGVKVKNNKSDKYTQYKNTVSAEDYKQIALILRDLKNLGKPIDKAIKEFNLNKSDWDAAIGL